MTVETLGASLEARTVAEEHVRPILDWPEPWLGLLVDQLGKAGWTQDRARAALRKRGWWL